MTKTLVVAASLLLAVSAHAEQFQAPMAQDWHGQNGYQPQAWGQYGMQPRSGLNSQMQQSRQVQGSGNATGSTQQRRSGDLDLEVEAGMSFRSSGRSAGKGEMDQSRRINGNVSQSRQFSNAMGRQQQFAPNVSVAPRNGWQMQREMQSRSYPMPPFPPGYYGYMPAPMPYQPPAYGQPAAPR